MKITTDMFTVQSSVDANYLSISVPEEAQLDEISMKVIQGDCPDFLLPFRMTAINDKAVLKYKLVNATALKYTNMTLSKNSFVKLYLNLLTPFIKGKDWFLDVHHICIDPQYVYCDHYTFSIHFIYVPEKSYYNSDKEILQFFKKVFVNTTISDDKDFQVRLFRYFSNDETTLADLYQLFKDEATKIATREQLRPGQIEAEARASVPANLSAEGSVKADAAIIRAERKTDTVKVTENVVEDERNNSVIEDLFSDKKKKKPEKKSKAEKKDKSARKTEKGRGFGGLFVTKKNKGQESMGEAGYAEKGKPQEMFMQDQQYLYTMTEVPEETEIFGGAVGSATASLELLDSAVPGAMPRIMLDFSGSYVTVGRISSDELKPDIAFPAEFKRIGRRHARIERRDGRYYIIDLGSMNHTLLDGRKLLPNQPYLLENGMEITFTDSKPVRYRVCL